MHLALVDITANVICLEFACRLWYKGISDSNNARHPRSALVDMFARLPDIHLRFSCDVS